MQCEMLLLQYNRRKGKQWLSCNTGSSNHLLLGASRRYYTMTLFVPCGRVFRHNTYLNVLVGFL